MKTTQYLLVYGRVQGVGFRYFTRNSAIHLGVTGWVRNLHDGRVELVAHGLPEILIKFKELLRRGPASAKVSSIEVQVVVTEQSMKEFEIREDGEALCLKK
ncbi:MAG: hypothetical protein A2Z20_01810 [Bdellovibrionales bacterium RBG_16_40_8]|nr:MAG: hypothetical protein A2Z20_01810 [Bdellovibrionales bacterium RBG_16_40_8]